MNRVQPIYTDLENAFLEFLSTDEEYTTTLKENEALQEEYTVINGMSPEDYSSSVEDMYEEAKGIYEVYAKNEGEKVFEKQVITTLKMMRSKIKFITHRDINDSAEMVEDKEELDSVMLEIRDMMTSVANYNGVKWEDTLNNLEGLLEECMQARRKIGVTLRRNAKSSESITSRDSVHETTVENLSPPLSVE